MAGEEPPYLVVGTEVSAKYRGAFCEAKVKKVVKSVKCRVSLKEGGSLLVQDDDIHGPCKVGRSVEVKHPESGSYLEGVLTKIMDQSVYTVIFDDADENTLRRSQLCLKGDKHFVKSETLDDLPLTHPEHFGTPVVKGGKGYKRKRAAAAMLDGSDSEIDDTSSEDSMLQKRTYRGRLQDLVGRVLCMEIEDRKKTLWVPVLVTQPTADDAELKSRDHLLVKSFKDSKFYTVSRRDAKEFTREMAVKNEDKALKAACEKALLYYDTRDLPQNWDREELLGSETADEEETESSDDEPSEEKDRFVAQLYKFMDDRGTPINKAPLIANRDLNLYRLFRVVQNLGGYNRVTNQMKWRLVYSKMNLPSSTNASNQIKTAYKKYLHAFEDFYRKLGSTMGTISRPSRSRHSSGRSLLSFRERERENSAPKSPGRASKKSKDSDSESDLEMDKDEAKPDSPTPDRIKTRSKLEEKVKFAKEESESESEHDEKPITRKGRTTRQTEEKKREDTPSKPATRETAKLAKEKESEDKRKTKDERPAERKSARKEARDDETPSERDEEEDDKSKKRQTRKKSARLAAEAGDKSEEKEEIDNRPERGKRKTAKDEPKEASDNEESDKTSTEEDYPLGTKLKVRYGKGKNQKLYEAKVLEIEKEGVVNHYKVHYAGWNNRYDEWVKKDRIVGVLSEPESKKGKHRPPPKPVKKEKEAEAKEKEESAAAPRKRGRPSEVDRDGRDSPRGKGRVTAATTPAKSQRPTRSTSVDNTNLSGGLPPKQRRTRRSSGVGPESTTSHVSGSENESSDEEPTDIAEPKHESGGEESVGGPQSSILEDTDVASKTNSAEETQLSDDEPEEEAEEKEGEDLPDLANMRRRKETEEKNDTLDESKDSKSEDKLTFDSDEDEEKDSDMEDRKLKIIKSLEEDDKSVKSVEKEEMGSVSDNMSQKGDGDKEPEKSKAKSKRKGKRRISETEAPAKPEEKSVEPPTPEKKEHQAPVGEEVKSVLPPPAEARVPAPHAEALPQEESPKKKGKTAKKNTLAAESPSKSKQTKVEKKTVKRKGDEEEVRSDVEEKSPKKKIRRKKKEEDKTEGTTFQTDSVEPASPSKVAQKTEVISVKTEASEAASFDNVSKPHAPEDAPMLSEPNKVEQKVATEGPAPQLSPVAPAKAQASAAAKGASSSSAPEKPAEDAGNRASTSFALYVNTPPETPEGSPNGRSPDQHRSPSQEDTASTKSERDANLEVANLMGPLPSLSTESPNVCDNSTLSNTSGGSSGNIPGSESEGVTQSAPKRPREEPSCSTESEKPAPSKRRKRNHKKGSEKSRRSNKTNLSDSDEASAADRNSASPTKSTNLDDRPKLRTPKYNFLNMAEYQTLEPDDRIKYILGKIADLKKIYTGLKAEVASIDRRRKRHRRKEREAKAEVSHASSQERMDSL